MHRNSGSICDKITSHRRPSDLLGQLLKKKKKKKKNFILYFHGTVVWVLLTCYKARVTSVEYNKVPEKAYDKLCFHIRGA